MTEIEDAFLFRCVVAVLQDFSELRHDFVYFWIENNSGANVPRYSFGSIPGRADGLVVKVSRSELTDDNGKICNAAMMEIAKEVFRFLEGEDNEAE